LFGCIEGWAYALVALLILAGFACWLVSLLDEPLIDHKVIRLYLPLVIMGVVFALQCVPLPGSVVRRISPEAFAVQAEASAVIGSLQADEVDDAEPCRVKHALSLSRTETSRALLLLGTYIAAFVVLSNPTGQGLRFRTTGGVLVASSCILAIVAIAQGYADTRQIYGFYEPRWGGNVYGPFSNRNHYALYMNMAFGLAVGLLLSDRFTRKLQHVDDWRVRISWLSTADGFRFLMAGFAALVIGASACMSLSRGGMTSLAAALAFVTAWSVRRKRGGSGRVLLALGLLVLSVVVWLGWRPVMQRLGTLGAVSRDPLNDVRVQATVATARLASQYPLSGCGLGAFKHVFPSVQMPSLQFGRWLHAHNDMIEFVAETGLLGMLFAAWILVSSTRFARSKLKRCGPGVRMFLLGTSLGLLSAAVHGFLDYGFHRAANMLMVCVLAGLSTAAFGDFTKPYASRRDLRRLRLTPATLAVIVLAGLVTLAGVRYAAGVFAREAEFARFVRYGRQVERISDRVAVTHVAEVAYTEGQRIVAGKGSAPEALVEVAVSNLRWLRYTRIEPAVRIALAKQGRRAARCAAAKAPSNYEHWMWWSLAERIDGRRKQADRLEAHAETLAPPGWTAESNGDAPWPGTVF
jgi:O-antigen ligase